jgi:hypothetical protein
VKNSLKVVSLVLLPFASFASSTWYFGAGVGQSWTSNDGKIAVNEPGSHEQSNKKDFNTRFLSAKAFVGQSTPVFNNAGNVLVEGFYAWNSEKTDVKTQGPIADIDVKIERPRTFGMNVGFAKPIDDGLDVVVKAGLVMSQFRTQLTDTVAGQEFSGTDTQFVCGFVPSLGVQKDFDSIKVGLSYSYYMYQNFTAKSINVPNQSTYSNTMNPRYHMVELSIAKHI